MKRILFFLIFTAVVIAAVVLYQENTLQTQLLRDQATNQPLENPGNDDCAKQSENAANTCYMQLALREKNADHCNKITRISQKRKCEREVDLAQ